MEITKELFLKKNFCILPFIHSATLTDGGVPLCCVSSNESKVNLNKDSLHQCWNSDYLKSVRLKMLANQPVNSCQRCYEEEKNGYRSHRVTENQHWKNKLGEERLLEIISKVDERGQTTEQLMAIDLRLGNTCNLQCVMCQPRESSKWKIATPSFIKELNQPHLISEWQHKSHIQSEKFEWYKNPYFWDQLREHLPMLREIIMGGGEPMLIKEHLNFIKACVESGDSTHIHLRYHTNMTLIPEDIVPYWEKFEKVEFFASIDGYSQVNDYVRYPSKWNVIEKNIRLIDSLPDNILLRFLYSVHALNVHHLPEFLRWIKSQEFKKERHFKQDTKSPGIQNFVHPGIVHWPLYLSIKGLPRLYKEMVTNSWNTVRKEFSEESFSKYEGIMNFMNSADESSHVPQLADYISALDKTRKTSIYDIAPDLAQALTQLKKEPYLESVL